MAIAESQLDTWSHQGSTIQSAATYATIRKVLEDPKAPYASRKFEIFLQGSYGNDTNIYADSDVDIVICLTSTYYPDISLLTEADKAIYESARSPASYSFQDFKREVASWLTLHFGGGVKFGRKAIFVPGEGSRRDADVLACAEHHRYRSYKSAFSDDFHRGICFWTSDGQYIINFPKQHSTNCTAKHQSTANWFKPCVRIVKNMRNRMQDRTLMAEGAAPSYFLEGMLFNVPSDKFGTSYQASFSNALAWLERADPSQLVCANGLHWLVRDDRPTSWRAADYATYLRTVRRFWENPS